jgi:hypothetical protein
MLALANDLKPGLLKRADRILVVDAGYAWHS